MSLNYKDRLFGGRVVGKELTYDAKTGEWVDKPIVIHDLPNSKTLENIPDSSKQDTSTSQVDSKTEADKEFIETEIRTLVGDVVLTPSKKSVRINVNNTVEIKGVGNYLSGNYFVSAVKRIISKDSGFSQTLTVMKNGFGDSLKQPKPAQESRKEEVEKSVPALKVGDSVKIVGEDAVYSNSADGVKVPEWVKQKTLTVRQISSDGTRVLLMPILSWTYVRYVQKV